MNCLPSIRSWERASRLQSLALLLLVAGACADGPHDEDGEDDEHGEHGDETAGSEAGGEEQAESGAEDDLVVDDESWIDSGPSGPPDEHPSLGGEGDDDDDDDDDGFFAAWGIFGQFSGGTLSEPEGEFFVEDNGQDLCILFFEVTLRGTVDGCDDCSQAWEFEFGEVEVDTDRGGACERYLDSEVEGRVVTLGQGSGETLWMQQDGNWSAIGEYFIEDEQEIFMEWSPR